MGRASDRHLSASRHQAMVDRLVARGRVTSSTVEAALRAVDRAGFVPEGDGDAAYDDAPIRLQSDDVTGDAVSTISQPSMVAYMLEELRVEAGHRVLEIGTASGYHAALLARLTGPAGVVVTVEIDEALAAGAARRLADVANVEVVRADGYDGHAAGAPYDRIVVTVGSPDVSPAWRDQLASGGRLVVPVTGADGRGLCLTLDEVDGRLEQRRSLPCGFVTMRRDRR
jgi:protein-L-isoaspartate(D-aspartate) O-methyltransferase